VHVGGRPLHEKLFNFFSGSGVQRYIYVMPHSSRTLGTLLRCKSLSSRFFSS
jgi:hypothetical protein